MSAELYIRRCFLCTFDPAQEFAGYNEIIPGSNDETAKYIRKLLLYNRDSMKSKPAVYDDDSPLTSILPSSEEGFEAFVNVIADEVQNLVREYSFFEAGCGLFVWSLIDEQNVISFFKLDYQSRLMNAVGNDGSISWKMNQSLLPGTGQKGYEFFMINLDMQRILVSDKVHYVNHDEPVNFMAEYLLHINLNLSEKEMLDKIDDVMMDTISEYCRDDASQKIFAYKSAMAEKVAQDGRIHMAEVTDEIFGDNVEAADLCRERLAQNHIPGSPVMVGNKSERSLQKKHKIVTASGIEILVPPELLDNDNFFKYSIDENGAAVILIRENAGMEE